jgi:archaellum component FlaG (FlaF/FlaG flagellin family)
MSEEKVGEDTTPTDKPGYDFDAILYLGDVATRTGRVYPSPLLESIRDQIAEAISSGRAVIERPSNGTEQKNFISHQDVIGNITKVYLKQTESQCQLRIAGTFNTKEYMDSEEVDNSMLRIVPRGMGRVVDGTVTDYKFISTTIDLTDE